MSDRNIKPGGEVTPADVQTPAQLRAFMSMLDQQVRDAVNVPEGAEPKYTAEMAISIAANIRARGIHWALTRVCEMLEKQELRVAELELTTVKAVRVEPD